MMKRGAVWMVSACVVFAACESPPPAQPTADERGEAQIQELRTEARELRASLDGLKERRVELESRLEALSKAEAEIEATRSGSARRRAGATDPDESSGEAVGEGFLTVNSTPSGQVYIDGKLVSSETPLARHTLAEGNHTVRVFYATTRKFSETKRAVITEGRHVSLYFQEQSDHRVTASDEVQFYRNGRLEGVGTEVLMRTSRSVQVVWLSDGTVSEAREVAGDVHFERSDPAASGPAARLFVEAEGPDGAEIWVDGVRVGTSPLKDYPILEGRHRVWAVRDDVVSAIEALRGVSGEEARVTLSFTAPTPLRRLPVQRPLRRP